MEKNEEAFLAPEERDSAHARNHWRITFFYLAVLVIIAFTVFKPWIHGTDGARNYAYLRSMIFDGDLQFANEFAHYAATGDYEGSLEADSATGHISTPVGIGSALLWMPFVLIGHLAALAGPWAADGYSPPYVMAVSLGSLFYGFAGIILLARILLRKHSPLATSITLVGVVFGTPLWFYIYLHPSMSHGCSFFLCTLAVWLFMRGREEARPIVLFGLGLVCGLAIATRFNNGVFLLLPAALVFHGWRTLKLEIPTLGVMAVLCGLGIFMGFAPQALAWRILHGSFLSGPVDGGVDLGVTFTLWKSPHALSILFSGRHGLFVWSPVLIAAAAGWVYLFVRGELLHRVLLVMFAAQLWVIGSWPMWWGGASFGQRFFLNHTAGFAFGLAALLALAKTRRLKFLLYGFMLLCLAWNAGLAVQYGQNIISREEHVPVAVLFKNQFTAVPSEIIGILKN